MNLDDIKIISGKKMLLEIDTSYNNPLIWAEENKKDVENFLSTSGALLIRGLNINGSIEFGQVLKSLFGEELVNYTYRSTPRTEVNNNVYTATEYHASEIIPQHNENAYSNAWPMRIGFVCMVPAAKMGNTPISDSRVAYNEIPKEIREEFERKKIMYVRNYSDMDLPWQEVFQTDTKAEVEKFCKDNRIDYQWTANGLRTKQVNQASILHPVTNEKLWFNQAHLFHLSSLDIELQEGLIELLGEENIPRNTFFGDGTPIDVEALTVIRDVYERTKFTFDWKKQDLLLLDNMLYTHGREPYEGTRQVLVGMAKKYSPII
ncbi:MULTISPECIES: TauD/TfdA family dioxygenase [Flavobacterium]|uniref:TauD/TfdA family dioxygenase n=1 Tax=Flavobacterium lipolyticum TaxID=2893754 RepID=A0ABS8M422_9FLAO|nr:MULTISPECIES: TauD/TfdA family dioxygenase [unclassified Flavobacterium]MCC9019507.1 TauD/TfdA family dioxygenase [Flavobacterium sp. F-126]